MGRVGTENQSILHRGAHTGRAENRESLGHSCRRPEARRPAPGAAAGNKAMVFGDYSYYWIADRTNRTFRRLNELYARTDQVGFLTTQRVDGKLILPEAVKCLQMKAGA